jgi:hypothetical protein
MILKRVNTYQTAWVLQNSSSHSKNLRNLCKSHNFPNFVKQVNKIGWIDGWIDGCIKKDEATSDRSRTPARGPLFGPNVLP